MCKLEKLYNFGLNCGTVGVATKEEIKEMCKDLETTVYSKTMAAYNEVQDFICCGGEISEGFYIVANGIIEVCGEEECWEIVLIENTIVV